MTGSRAPQRAVRRLARLGVRAGRLAAVLGPSALLDDPLAGLTAWPLDETMLEAVLLRLEGIAVAEGTAATPPSRRSRSGRSSSRSRSAPVALSSRVHRGELPFLAARERRARTLSGKTAAVRVATTPRRTSVSPAPAAAAVAGSRKPGSPHASSPLARAAGRVPGGRTAVLTPIAAAWTAADPVGAATDAALLRAALARAVAQPMAAGEPRHDRPRGAEPSERLTSRRSGADDVAPAAGKASSSESEPARRSVARVGGEPATGTDFAAERDEADGIPPLAGGGGLAELVRRWERAHGDDQPPAAQVEREPDAVAGIDAESALARAVERLLAAELRRSGIEVNVG